MNKIKKWLPKAPFEWLSLLFLVLLAILGVRFFSWLAEKKTGTWVAATIGIAMLYTATLLVGYLSNRR